LPPPPRPTYCGARTREGDSCRRAPVRGTNRCSLHGGNAPQVKRRVMETMAAAALPAAEFLLDLIERWRANVCETCGLPKGDPNPVIKAATAVLDRTGFGSSAKLNVHHSLEEPFDGDAVAAWMPDHQLEQIDAWMREAQARMERGEPKPTAG